MATDNSGDLSAFIQFASAQLQAGAKLSLGEAIDQWYVNHPEEISDEDNDEIVGMAQEALEDIAAGVPCISSEEFERELEREFGLKPPTRRS